MGRRVPLVPEKCVPRQIEQKWRGKWVLKVIKDKYLFIHDFRALVQEVAECCRKGTIRVDLGGIRICIAFSIISGTPNRPESMVLEDGKPSRNIFVVVNNCVLERLALFTLKRRRSRFF